MSDAVDQKEQFLSNSVIPRLVTVIGNHISDVEIVFNISRLFRYVMLALCSHLVGRYMYMVIPYALCVCEVHTCRDGSTFAMILSVCVCVCVVCCSKLTIQSEYQVAVMQCSSLLPLLLQALTVHSSHAVSSSQNAADQFPIAVCVPCKDDSASPVCCVCVNPSLRNVQ